MYVKKVEVEEVSTTLGKPDPNCPKCKGTGHYHGLWCTCTIENMTFGPTIKKNILVAVEETKDGGVRLDFRP